MVPDTPASGSPQQQQGYADSHQPPGTAAEGAVAMVPHAPVASASHQQQQQQQQQTLPLEQQQQLQHSLPLQQQQQQQPEQLSDVKVQALEALNSAFCRHIYSTALSYLQQQYSFERVTQQFLDILERDDPFESPCSIAHAEGNSGKNRYRDVVPYDHNRVLLPPLLQQQQQQQQHHSSSSRSSCAGADHSNSSSKAPGTYINASYMTDPWLPGDANQVLGYIATQGPLPSTVADLWRMVAVTNTSAIVMLTGLTDGSTSLGNSRPRCASYFPDKEQDCLRLPGSITVTCVHKNSLDENVFFRQLEVAWAPSQQQQQQQLLPAQPQQQQQQLGQSGAHAVAQQQLPSLQPQRLWINHYQYANWPDYGIPPATSSVRVLCHALDGCRRAGCKIVVHCSAGVGRTGTFVAVDMLLQRLHSLTLQLHGTVREEDIQAAVDIPGLVASLRKQRRGTVQTAEQYAFVWQALMDEIAVLLQEQQDAAQDQQQQQQQAGPEQQQQ
ncbi:protein-tyrosine phosphatase-like protein [Scenedesmus sp. NREL 46B-D3]|nr:protein-tyrosine phosphatase-like protein [Scenedesmus sp. NREL 46B-D3]